MSNRILLIEATEETPMVEISVSPNTCSVQVKGISMPENTLDFYLPLFEKLNTILKKDMPTILRIELEYMNSMSNKQIIKMIDSIRKKCNNFKVDWRYSSNDSLMKMKGEEIRAVMKDIEVSVSVA